MTRRLQTESLVDPLYKEQKSFKEKYPLNSFLKTPKIKEKQEQMKKWGLEMDPNQFPGMNYTDPAFADYFRHRTSFDAAADFRASQPHSDSDDEHYGTKDQATSSEAHVTADARERGHKVSERRYGKLAPGLEYRNRRNLANQQRELERGMAKIGLGSAGTRDWYE